MALPKALNFYTNEELDQFTNEQVDGTRNFDIFIDTQNSRCVISGMSSFDSTVVTFTPTSDIDKWECRATLLDADYGVGVGLLIASGDKVFADVEKQFVISYAALTFGDGVYRISLYVQLENNWYGGNDIGN